MTGGLPGDVARRADIIPRAEMRSLVEHLKGRARSFSVLFIVALIIGYPIAERMISWAANNTGWRPEGVDIVIIQPLELILLKLRISVHIALGATMLALIFDLAWNGREIIARGKRTMVKEGSFVRLAGVCLASVALAMLGLFYANSILIPFLLEYLHYKFPKRSCVPFLAWEFFSGLHHLEFRFCLPLEFLVHCHLAV